MVTKAQETEEKKVAEKATEDTKTLAKAITFYCPTHRDFLINKPRIAFVAGKFVATTQEEIDAIKGTSFFKFGKISDKPFKAPVEATPGDEDEEDEEDGEE